MTAIICSEPSRSGSSPVRVHRPLLAALAALAVAGTAAAQTQFQLTSPGNVVSGGVYVGPYRGVLGSGPGAPTIDVTCVDYFNQAYVAPDPRSVWQVNQTTLADGANLANTRFGAMDNALVRYRQTAWLSWQFANAPTSEWGNIHRTIWNVFTGAAPDPANSYWLTAAQTWYAANGATYDWSTVVVLSDASMTPSTSCATCPKIGGRQEFITTTPEPATLLMLGSGLLILLGAAVSRGTLA